VNISLIVHIYIYMVFGGGLKKWKNVLVITSLLK
jgi:hypothetical protein